VVPRRRHLAVIAGAITLVPSLALASNMTHPRTPVVWEDVPCLTLHDRSAEPTVHLPYTIPKEDLEVGPDEVADSRRHQFFAFCRPHHPQDFLPSWVTQADVDDALAIPELVTGEVTADDVLELNPRWSDCFFRINADDERRPISFEMAAEGVTWDLAATPDGVYTLYGYTYEPEFNIWSLRPGVFKLYDGDPHAVGPALAITTGELTPYRDEEVMVEGCAHALPGSTYTVFWALTPEPYVEPDWVEYLDEELPGEEFAFGFTPPEEMWGQSGMMRIDVTDPEGRTYTAYQADPMLVINESDPNACNDGTSFIGSPGCDDDTTGADSSGTSNGSSGDASVGTSSDDSDGTGTTVPMQTSGGDEGGGTCACTSDRGPGLGGVVLLGIFGLARRRRR